LIDEGVFGAAQVNPLDTMAEIVGINTATVGRIKYDWSEMPLGVEALENVWNCDAHG
jgi:hypothetical protein